MLGADRHSARHLGAAVQDLKRSFGMFETSAVFVRVSDTVTKRAKLGHMREREMQN